MNYCPTCGRDIKKDGICRCARVSDSSQLAGSALCEFFKDKKVGETFWLLAELFQKIDDETAVKVEGFYKFDPKTNVLTKSA
jgi:hypothetical protein